MTHNKIVVFQVPEFKKFVGEWAFVSFSNYNSDIKKYSSFFPNMFNLFINENDSIRSDTYFIPSPGMAITEFNIGYQIMGLFADLNIYKNFIFNGKGFVSAFNGDSKTKDRISYYSLSSNVNNGCVIDADLDGDTPSSLGLDCVADFNPYLDQTSTCKSNTEALEYLSPSKMTCKKCSSKNCPEGLCSSETNYACSCNYNEKYWIRYNIYNNNYFCESIYYFIMFKIRNSL
jgi:hypothetical protein